MSNNAVSANVADRPDPRVERSRTKLLSAAVELLVEGGPQAVTVDSVSERSGVAKSTLYRHWPSRAALLVAVIESKMPCVPDLDASLGFERSLRDHVRALANTLADPDWFRILPGLLTLRHDLPECGELTEQDSDEKLRRFRDLLALGATEGVVPAGLDPRLVALTLVGPMMMCAVYGDPTLVHEAAEFAVDRFLASYRHA